MLSFLGGAAFSHSNPTIQLQQLVPLSSTAPPLDGRRLPRVSRWGYRLASPSSDSEDSEDTKRGNVGLNPTTTPFIPVHIDDLVTVANRYQWHVRWDMFRTFDPTKISHNPTAAQIRAGHVQFGQPKPDRRSGQLFPEFEVRRQPGRGPPDDDESLSRRSASASARVSQRSHNHDNLASWGTTRGTVHYADGDEIRRAAAAAKGKGKGRDGRDCLAKSRGRDGD